MDETMPYEPQGNVDDMSQQQDLGFTQAPPEKKHDSVITFTQKKQEGPPKEVMELNAHVAEIGRRIRIIEERYSNLRRKTQVTDQNMLTIQKSLTREVKALSMQVDDLEKEISLNDSKVSQVIRELSAFARSDDLKVLKRYTEFWEPLSYVTKKEAERIISEKVSSKISQMQKG